MERSTGCDYVIPLTEQESGNLDNNKGSKARVRPEEMPVKKGQIIEEIANPEVLEQDYDSHSEAESHRAGERDHDVISAAGSEANGRQVISKLHILLNV